jgi:arylamine N-acetyltransferase
LHPIPISLDAQDNIYNSVPGAYLRLQYRSIASNTTSQKLWVLEQRTGTHTTWQGGYCFDLLEWLPSDFAIINYRTSQDRASWFTHQLVLVKILVDEETRTKALGTMILSNQKFERRLSQADKEVVLEAKTEQERIDGLKKWFGIVLSPAEQRGIRGTAAEITKPPSV